jgi:hypothetical protein
VKVKVKVLHLPLHRCGSCDGPGQVAAKMSNPDVSPHVGRVAEQDRDPGMQRRHVRVPIRVAGLRRKTVMQMQLGTGDEMR